MKKCTRKICDGCLNRWYDNDLVYHCREGFGKIIKVRSSDPAKMYEYVIKAPK